jgi:hypothetical protein
VEFLARRWVAVRLVAVFTVVGAVLAPAVPALAGSLTISVGSWVRNQESGSIAYDMTISAGGAAAPGAPCETRCEWLIEAWYRNGTTNAFVYRLASQLEAGGTASFSRNVSSPSWDYREVTHVRGTLRPSYVHSSNQRWYTDWIQVAQPGTGGVDLNVKKWVDHGSSVSYDLFFHAREASRWNGPCDGTCDWVVQAWDRSGETDVYVAELARVREYQTPWTFSRPLSGSAALQTATHLRAYLKNYYSGYDVFSTWVFVGDNMINDKDLVPYSIALASAYAANSSQFCEPLLLKPYPNTNGNSLNDIYESCEALVASGATLAFLLQQLEIEIPDSVDDLVDFWENNPAPTEEDRQRPLPGPPVEDDPDCVQEIREIDDAAAKIEGFHVWGAGEGRSEFYPWADWRWLAKAVAEPVHARPSSFDSSKCQRVVSYEPTHVGITRFSLEPTSIFTVVTWPNGKLYNMYPGTIAN